MAQIHDTVRWATRRLDALFNLKPQRFSDAELQLQGIRGALCYELAREAMLADPVERRPCHDPGTILRTHAGAILCRKNRKTGTVVTIYRTAPAGLDTEDGPYATVCEEHGCIVNHRTLRLASSHLSHPDEWCEGCQGVSP